MATVARENRDFRCRGIIRATGDYIKRLVKAWAAAKLDGHREPLAMILDAVYVDMAQDLVLGLKPKPEFLPFFNLGEPVTTGDAELVTGGMEQS